MKKTFAICYLLFAVCAASAGHAAVCSRAALTQCLDSTCAANIGMNPAARCQLCGTSQAGAPTASNLRNVSIGANSRNILSESELKIAPSNPGDRYIWATRECTKKIAGCTEEDVSKTYDSLIEQSCKAAGIEAKMAEINAAAQKTKTSAACQTEINSCLIAPKNCGGDLTACENDADFDKFFSACAVSATGCDAFTGEIRTKMLNARNASLQNKDTLLYNIVIAYQNARANKLKIAQDSCKNNQAMQDCVKTVCENNMNNKCGDGFQSEGAMATLLCKFHEIACDRLR